MNQPAIGLSGVLLRVGNLDQEKIFYRDFLRLGEPVVDSGFWVEFRTPGNSRVILEKSEAPYLEHESSATTLVLATPECDAIRAELARQGFTISAAARIYPGEVFYRGQDPEGNIFYLTLPNKLSV